MVMMSVRASSRSRHDRDVTANQGRMACPAQYQEVSTDCFLGEEETHIYLAMLPLRRGCLLQQSRLFGGLAVSPTVL